MLEQLAKHTNAALAAQLQTILPGAEATAQPMPLTPAIRLFLLAPDFHHHPYSAEESQRIMAEPPYWSFCWASGQVLAKYILDHPETVAGKRVVDFGSGSGIVAIAALLAGAETAVACDIDPQALIAARENGYMNSVELALAASLDEVGDETDEVDLILAADVLYDLDNRPLLGDFIQRAPTVLVADSRAKQIDQLPYGQTYRYQATGHATTLPDYGEFDEFKEVKIYRAAR